MPVVNPEKLIELQRSPEFIRNDHGKTSLTDSLLATNGIVSPKMAGKVRYLDSRPDEQIRGITMESSAISLFFSLLRKQNPAATPEKVDHLINLIDSPGHVDFSSEVSTASRLCDGAVILVDAVEGVCSQTVAVLRQTWIERLKPILVINKMDRLITELRMSPGEAYSHLSKLIEQVNAVVGSFYQGERMEDDLKWRERVEQRITTENETPKHSNGISKDVEDDFVEDVDDLNLKQEEYEEKDDEDIYFEPERGNVIFSSAVDGWAFTTKQFADIYEKKLGVKRALLERVLWGDYYLDPKTKRILASKHLKGKALKPMFVQLVLENIWAIYDAATGGEKGKGDPARVEKIIKSLSLQIPAHVLRSRDPRAILTALFAAWIPLSTAVLVSVLEHLPSPKAAQEVRMPGLLDGTPGSTSIDDSVRKAIQGLEVDRSEPRVAFVSKMVAVPTNDLPENKTKSGFNLTADEARELGRKKRAEIARAQAVTNGEEPDLAELRERLTESTVDDGPLDNGQQQEHHGSSETLIGFARLFSGTFEIGDEVFVLNPKFSPANAHASPEPQKVTVTALYLLMGRSLEPLKSVPAGVVFGIAGFEGHIMKSATLCSQLEGSVNLAGVQMGTQPIVRIALEPENPADLDKMVLGLRLLQQSDPCASYEILENGEHVILTAGELHLERCLKDLRERFARCEIQQGAPIVPFRESIVSAAEMNPPRNQDLPRGTQIGVSTSKQVSMRMRVRPLPENVTEFLLRNSSTIRELYKEHPEELSGESSDEDEESDDDVGHSDVNGTHLDEQATTQSLQILLSGLEREFEQVTTESTTWKNLVSKIIAFGPRRNGPNILADLTSNESCKELTLRHLLDQRKPGAQANGIEETLHTQSAITRDFADKISYAFQIATLHGPLCQEPMQGVAVILEEVSISTNNPSATSEDSDAVVGAGDRTARLSGEIIKTATSTIRDGFLDWSPRLLLAMYSCEIQASTEVLGRVYGVITRRRGHILSESMNEGTPFFTIVSVLPVVESFGFSEEIRKRTSGAASPQLIFRGFEMLDQDPFWVPFTEEELEDLGELADRENLAKRYMDAVRKRKGLFVQGRKLVVSAEKQKTLKK